MSRWSPFWQDLIHSEKVNALSDMSFRVWTHLVVSADALGRLPASPSQIKTRSMPARRIRPENIERALTEISSVGSRLNCSRAPVGLIHMYSAADGSRYLVLHDWRDWRVGVLSPHSDCPPPPKGLCRCCDPSTREKEPPSPSLSRLSEGQEGMQGEPGEAAGKLRLARAYQVANGGGTFVGKVAEHFAALCVGRSPVAPEFFEAHVFDEDLLGLAPWELAKKMRALWREHSRRGQIVAPFEPFNPKADTAAMLSDPARRRSFIASMVRGIRSGLVKLDAVYPELRDEVRAELERA